MDQLKRLGQEGSGILDQLRQQGSVAKKPEKKATTVPVAKPPAPANKLPKIEIKNVKHSEFASQETNCFEATVYLDGVRSFIVSNDGHGGCDNYHALPGKGNVWELVKSLNEQLAKGPKIKSDFPDGMELTNCLELVIGDLLTEHLMMKDLKKLLRKVVVEDEGKIYSFKISAKQLRDEVRASIRYEHPKAVILNDLPLDEAFKIYKKSAGG